MEITQKDFKQMCGKAYKWNKKAIYQIEDLVQDAYIECHKIRKPEWDKKKFISVWQNCLFLVSKRFHAKLKYNRTWSSKRGNSNSKSDRVFRGDREIAVSHLYDRGYHSDIERTIFYDEMLMHVCNLLYSQFNEQWADIIIDCFYNEIALDEIHKQYPHYSKMSLDKLLGRERRKLAKCLKEFNLGEIDFELPEDKTVKLHEAESNFSA